MLYSEPGLENSCATEVINNLTKEPSYVLQEQESISVYSTARRRIYTKAEKESFERWIADNPKPSRSQKIKFAKEHSFTMNQLQNLINNRRRGLKSMEGKSESHARDSNQVLLCHSESPFNSPLNSTRTKLSKKYSGMTRRNMICQMS